MSRIGLVRIIIYRGLSVAANATIKVKGSFAYGSGCGIGVGANILIPQHATLSLGDDCYIGRYVELGPLGCIKVGNNSSIQDRCILLGDVIIGRYCSLAPNIYISSGRHYFDLKPSWLIKDQDHLVASNRQLSGAHSKPVIVEDDCWLGINVVVLAGVTIGKGAVVGANSVVTNDVEPYTVVAGIPAKVIKKRLEFLPPLRIAYDNQNDWPYFYAGFEMSKKLLEKYSAYEGVLAQNEFVISMDASSGNSIHLIIKCIGSNNCVLIFDNQRKLVSNQFEEVVFQIYDHTRNTSRLYMNTNMSDAQLIVKEVRIQ
jgi:acetyltransferase-like isoleucine patch superfamily enzyme